MPNPDAHQPDGPPDSLAALTPREAELLRQAGDRVFALSRDLAIAENEVTVARAGLAAAHAQRDEALAGRDARALRLETLEGELGRALEERAELRQLIQSLEHRLKVALAAAVQPAGLPSGADADTLDAAGSTARRLLSPLRAAYRAAKDVDHRENKGRRR